MARFGKTPWICPFCGADKSHHRIGSTPGGYGVAVHCDKCKTIGPRVGLRFQGCWPRKGDWRRARARELFYGVPDPVLSSHIPPLP